MSMGLWTGHRLLRPYAAAVTLSDGQRCGAVYGTLTDQIYDRFSVLLGEALDGAGVPVTVSEEEWQGGPGGAGGLL